MAKHVGEKFADQRILLDGESYDRCTFDKCVVVYRGGQLASLVNCSFNDCRFELEDAAQRTLEFLNAIYHGFGDVGMRLVEETFNSIRRPRPAGPPPKAATSAPPATASAGGAKPQATKAPGASGSSKAGSAKASASSSSSSGGKRSK